MSMTLKEHAWQSGLVLSDEKWNETDWPPLKGGWRESPASVVLNHAEQDNTRGQTVVLLGGHRNQGTTDSVLVLNLADLNKHWREGPSMNKGREEHAAVVCNGSVYVMGGRDHSELYRSIERIDASDLLQSSFTPSSTHDGHWTTLNCRLSRGRSGCCAVSVHNRYIVVMGGWNWRKLSLVEIMDTCNHTVIEGPSLNSPRECCASAVIGHRIFVVGGSTTNTSVKYLDFTKPCDNEERNDNTLSPVISFSSTWRTHSSLVISFPHIPCAMVAVGSCLVVAGGENNPTVEVLDTHRNCVWNLTPLRRHHEDCSMVTCANQVAVIGENPDPTCATLPLMDKNTWCFCRLCEQPWNDRYQFREGSCARDANGSGIRNVNVRPCLTPPLARKRAWPNRCHGDKGNDEI